MLLLDVCRCLRFGSSHRLQGIQLLVHISGFQGQGKVLTASMDCITGWVWLAIILAYNFCLVQCPQKLKAHSTWAVSLRKLAPLLSTSENVFRASLYPIPLPASCDIIPIVPGRLESLHFVPDTEKSFLQLAALSQCAPSA